jgi:PAS domain S-box-containing protein
LSIPLLQTDFPASARSGKPFKEALRGWALPILAVTVLAATLSWDAWQSYRRSLEQEYRYLDSHARIADAQLSGALRAVDLSLQEIASRLPLSSGDAASLGDILADRANRFPEMRIVFVSDRNGRMVAISDPTFAGFDASGREYFTHHRDDPRAGELFVSRPYLSAQKQYVVAVSRALFDAEGSFAGIIGASIDPEFFKAVLDTVRPEGTGHALLVNTAGDILYDVPQPELTGKNLRGGLAYEAHLAAGARSTRHLSPVKFTGIVRVSVLRRLDVDPGLIAFVSRDYSEVLAAWRGNLLNRILMFAAAAAAIFYLGWRGRRHQDRLASAKADLQRLIVESPLPMMIAQGAGHNVILLNRRFSELTGYESTDLPDIGHWYRLAYPDAEYRRSVRRDWQAHYERAKDSGETMPPFEATIRCKNGEERTFDCYLTRFDDRAVVVFVDLTERRRLAAIQRESEAQLRKAQEITHVGSWSLDLADSRLTWSDEAYRIFDVAPGTPLDYELFLSRVHPDDRDRVDRAWRAALGGAPYDIEHRILAQGETRWVRELAELEFGRDNRAVSAIGTAHDITERKQAELQLRLAATVFENSREGVTITDLQRNIISVNPAFSEITGYPAEEVIGRNPRLLQSGRQDAAFYKAMWDSIDFKGYWSGEIWNRRKNGEIYPEILSISVVEDRDGRPTHYIGVFTDITESKRAEDEIRSLNADLEWRVRERTAELENSNRELESFSYSVSHDLRAPLRAIDGFSHVIAEEYGEAIGESGRDNLQRIRRAAQKMGTLIDNLLDLAQVSRQGLRREQVDLSRLVVDLAQEIDESTPQRKVAWVVQPGLAAQGDLVLLKVALNNLLRNAWKFTAHATAPRIEFGRLGATGEYFIRDNGAGIDMAYADKLFQPFQRMHSPKDFEGTGIGLAIVHRVIRRHGGGIRVESAPGQGATFYFTLG